MTARKPQPPAWWYGDETPPLHAQVLSQVYGAAIALRKMLYRVGILKRWRALIPVVVVGNLTAGGTGKTPLTIAIVERLRAAGWQPGVASRGYGRRDASQALWVDAKSDPDAAGDEPVLIARRSGAKVRVDRDRVDAANTLAEAGCDIVICDDGLQHYRLARDIEIEVVDGARRYGNGRLLPAGPMRELAERAQACDFRVVNQSGIADGEQGFGEWPMRLACDVALPLLGGRPRPLSAFEGQRVHAVAGIGNPERFFAMLRELGIAVVPHAFADHHRYAAVDFQFGSDLPVLMTEKDAVKCSAFASDRSYSVPVRAMLPEAFWIALQHRFAAAQRGCRMTPLSRRVRKIEA